MSHTKGPWKFDVKTGRIDGDVTICLVCELDLEFARSTQAKAEKEYFANAHLIETAPDLLEVCEALIGILTPKQYERQFPNVYKRAKNAIKKARGEA